MTNNIFTIESQAALSNLIHRPTSMCDGKGCDACTSFHKARVLARQLAETQGVELLLTSNAKPIGVVDGYYQVWCDSCSDGVNENFVECTYWARTHAHRQHGIVAL